MLEHGSHNVSRWMTWLPISLKNAAKCDKWYQLQNPSITEFLNAKGAWEKLSTGHPRACRILSVEQKTPPSFWREIHVFLLEENEARTRALWRWVKSNDPRRRYPFPCGVHSSQGMRDQTKNNQKNNVFFGSAFFL